MVRVAVVEGCRTAFVRYLTLFAELSTVDLGRHVVTELLARTELDPRLVEEVSMGVVAPPTDGPNLAREVVLRVPRLARSCTAHTVSQACISSLAAIAAVARRIQLGEITVAVAGGAESLSLVPFTLSRRLAQALATVARTRGALARAALLARLRPRDLVPVAPALVESFTGLSMGESCEKMAKENDIARQAQDRYALVSHQRSAQAMADGRLAADIAPMVVPPRYTEAAHTDTNIRADSSPEALAALPPSFDRRHGTLTAGNSSPITDGAAAVLLMAEERARALGYRPLGYLRAGAFGAVDPTGQLLMGPTVAIPRALDAAGASLKDMEVVEMHEAFAAQVLSTLQALASDRYGRDVLGRAGAVGEIDPARLNPMGGSIALGHPFGATGARLVMQLLRELRRRGQGIGLVSACAAGGLGAAMVFAQE